MSDRYMVNGTSTIVEILGWHSMSPEMFLAMVVDVETGDSFLVREGNLTKI